MTQQEVALHQLQATDIKNYIQILTPIALAPKENVDDDLKEMATKKLKEFIEKAKVFEESPIRKLN